jgi:hypothetical protein
MNDEYTVILHDLSILEEMAAHMDAYLISDAKEWTLPRLNMPKLTIGGYLMRQERLLALKAELQEEDLKRLTKAIKQFDDTLVEKVVRFETRAHQELHTRIGEWVSHLRDLGRRSSIEVNFYVGIVDIRVVISCLIDKLQTKPYKLDASIIEEMRKLDQNLRQRVVDHPFIWDSVWEPAYSREKYWWLYGYPKGAEVTRP